MKHMMALFRGCAMLLCVHNWLGSIGWRSFQRILSSLSDLGLRSTVEVLNTIDDSSTTST